MIIIEHDMTLLSSLCDRLVALELGAVTADGRPAEVLAHEAVIASYLGGEPETVARSGARNSGNTVNRTPRRKASVR